MRWLFLATQGPMGCPDPISWMVTIMSLGISRSVTIAFEGVIHSGMFAARTRLASTTTTASGGRALPLPFAPPLPRTDRLCW